MKTIKAAVFEQIARRMLLSYETLEDATQAMSAASNLSPNGWAKRLTPGPNSWFGRDLTIEQMDEYLIAADATHLWHVAPLAGKRKVLRCEDCKIEIEPGNYRPLDLFRPTPGASGKWVWDATKGKWARRPAQGPGKRARRNGRRFRVRDLCRRCAGEALRQRAARSTTVMENGKRRTLSTKERVAPKRGGRPRLLTDAEIQAAYRVYVSSTLSRNEIARRVWAAKGVGSLSGYQFALHSGWRRLGLKLTRDLSTQLGMSLHGTDGTKTKSWKQQCKAHLSNGDRCTQWTRVIREEASSHPAEDGLCWNHAAQVQRQIAA